MFHASRSATQQVAANHHQSSTRKKRASGVTLADLCVAIAKGHLPTTVDENGCYNVKKRAVKAYFPRLGRATPELMASRSRN